MFLVNMGAGAAHAQLARVEAMKRDCDEAGYRTSLVTAQPDELEAVVRDLDADASLVIVCGGDGTVRTCADLLAGSDHSMGVLPLGTFNMFARSLGLSLEPAEALQQLLAGTDEPLDAGSANGKLFLNTCLLGHYPRLVALREKRRRRHPRWPKFLRWALDTAVSAAIVLYHWRHLRFVLEVDGEYIVGKVVTFAVTNNEKSFPPDTESLSDGELVLYMPEPVSRLGLIRLALRGIFTHPRELEPLRVMRAKEIEVHLPDGTPLTIDGESDVVDGELSLRVLPRHCRVRVPPGANTG